MQASLSLHQWVVLLLFISGYLCIIFERAIGINKTTSALFTAAICWIAQFMGAIPYEKDMLMFQEGVAETAQIVFFLLGALTIVETIRVHGGLNLISRTLRFHSKKVTLWIIGCLSFVLSAILDNLTTTIVMVILIRQLIRNHEERLLFGAVIVIAANAGGAWTPIGDVTTTMLWVAGRITTAAVMKNTILPSIACLIISLAFATKLVKGSLQPLKSLPGSELQPKAKTIMACGFFSLVLVPILRTTTGLPPFMGIFVALAFLWLLTDIFHKNHPERSHLRMPAIFGKIDLTSVLFFLGILLSVGVLRIGGILKVLATQLDALFINKQVIPLMIGMLSAIVDNVPIIAGCMGMYDFSIYPTDSSFWLLTAYCAGTGGSLLIIGSAAGVAFMGLEKVDFFWYVRKASLPALAGYMAGIATYILQTMVTT